MKSVDGYDSFITFIDDYSRFGYIYPIKERIEALDKLGKLEFGLFRKAESNV